ncbi:hypothetical protein AWC38_SpisGene23892 [Stylophora pistillata]|uniref:Uncharacterized protein n=1 Tax=Stylophora pistillata TaxID=50429 RepID=A0A2B4R719_STYPI|nr:hypothetical protein AWC38_SpisGene23892 [Stylophora pistillata]
MEKTSTGVLSFFNILEAFTLPTVLAEAALQFITKPPVQAVSKEELLDQITSADNDHEEIVEYAEVYSLKELADIFVAQNNFESLENPTEDNTPHQLSWGHEKEVVAIKEYIKKHRIKHRGLEVFRSGLIVDKQESSRLPVKFDKELWDKMVGKLSKLFLEHMVPELLSGKILEEVTQA